MEANPPRDSGTFRSNKETNSSYDVNLTVSWQADNFGVPEYLNGETYHLQVPQEILMPPHAYVS